jgi:hypothetical protein
MQYNNTNLRDLIEFLKGQPQHKKISIGFGSPHSDRGAYENLAFEPFENTTIGEMLYHAESAVGKTFEGWKGGDFTMDLHTSVYIGEYGECGDPITPFHFKVWGVEY